MRPSLGELAPDVWCLGPWGWTQTNVYLVRDGGSVVLVDAGWPGDAEAIEQAVRELAGPGVHPSAIVLTHAHPDHDGAAGTLARRWGCEVWMHPAELPIELGDLAAMEATAHPLDRWLVLPLLRAISPDRREAQVASRSLADVARTFTPDDEVPGLPSWRCVPTPGHTPGHVSFLRRQDRVLLAGDALVTVRLERVRDLLAPRPGLSGPPWYTTWDRRAGAASIAALLDLEPTVIAGGHGRPLTGSAARDAVSWWQRAATAAAGSRHGPTAGPSVAAAAR